MRVSRRPSLLVNIALGAVVLAGGWWAYQTVHVKTAAAASTSTSSRKVQVTTGAVVGTVSATGSVGSAHTANANFITSGTVTEVDVKVGDVVTAGELLGRVDPTAASETLATAKANLTAAKANLTRVENAAGDNAAVTSAKAQVTNAQAGVDADQRAVDGCNLWAPMAGTVTAVNGSVGGTSSGSSSSSGTGGGSNSSSSSSSSSSSGFVVLADLTSLQANASFAEADATKLVVGQPVTLTWNAITGATATGKVTAIAPTATTTNSVNTYAVVASIDKAPTGARLGQTISVKVTVADSENVVRVPLAAVRTAGNRYTVEVSTNGVSSTVGVTVGVKGDTYYEIKTGLTAGQTVVIAQTVATTSSTGTGFGGGGFGGGGFGGGGAGGFAGGGAGRGGN